MKNIFLAVILGMAVSAGTAVAEIVASASPMDASAPAVVYVQPAPAVNYPQSTFVLWPAMSFHFGFGHPYVSGYYRGGSGRAIFARRP
jgi:hypothetical protein